MQFSGQGRLSGQGRRFFPLLGLMLVFFGNANSLGQSLTLDQVRSIYFPTGNMERDMTPTRLPGTIIALDNNGQTNDVAQAAFITNNGWLTGWNYKDIRFYYDTSRDILAVGVNFFKNPDLSPVNIAGDADGNGNPGQAAPQTLLAGGVDLANLGGRESITLGFDTNLSDAAIDFVSGVPADKTSFSNPNQVISTFELAKYNDQGLGIERSYGVRLPGMEGLLAYNPSAQSPDFAFTINNFAASNPGLFTPRADGLVDLRFAVQGYAGTLDDVVAGEDLFSATISITVPEPATYLAWMVLAVVGFAWHRSRRAAVHENPAL